MKLFVSPLLALSCLIGNAVAAWPNGPFKTEGRWIVNANGDKISLAGANWPGHGEVMVPEGLQYQSIKDVLSDIKSIGMNAIRLTFATELVDQIYANNGKDVDLKTAFEEGLGKENGTIILQKVLKNNPSFTAQTTRLEVCLIEALPIEVTLTSFRSTTPLLLSVFVNRSTLTLTTTSPRPNGAVAVQMATLGGEIPNSMSTTGFEVENTWQLTCVLLLVPLPNVFILTINRARNGPQRSPSLCATSPVSPPTTMLSVTSHTTGVISTSTCAKVPMQSTRLTLMQSSSSPA
jgi:hypothetical protein